MLVAQARANSFNLCNALKYSLGPLPCSIASTNRCLMRTNKAKLLELLESRASPCDASISQVLTWMYNSMALVQSINSQALPDTMAQLAQYIFSLIMKHAIANNHM